MLSLPFLRLSRLQAGRFLEACRLFLVPAREARRLLDADKTFGETRCGTGNTHTLGQILPRSRALDSCLSCGPQARLRTLPVSLGKRGKEGLQMQMRRQKRRVQVTLHRANPTRALVPALGERFLDVGATAMTILRELGALRGDARPAVLPVRGPGASEDCYEHPWSAESHAAAKLARPAAVRNLLGDDGVAHGHDLVSQLAMQALALRRQGPFLVGHPTARRL